jgi:2-methylcitrate dehydratase PrpD
MTCVEDRQFSRDYLDPDKRSIANAITVEWKDGNKTREVVVEYPIGHRRRRNEGIPLLIEKFRTNLARRFPEKQQQRILDVALDANVLDATPGPRVRRPVRDLTLASATRSHRCAPFPSPCWLPQPPLP